MIFSISFEATINGKKVSAVDRMLLALPETKSIFCVMSCGVASFVIDMSDPVLSFNASLNYHYKLQGNFLPLSGGAFSGLVTRVTCPIVFLIQRSPLAYLLTVDLREEEYFRGSLRVYLKDGVCVFQRHL